MGPEARVPGNKTREWCVRIRLLHGGGEAMAVGDGEARDGAAEC